MRDLHQQKNSKRGIFGLDVPSILRMPAVGLNMSDHSIKVIELVPKKKHFTVGKYMNKYIPDGIITGGIVKDNEALVSILKSIKKDLDLCFIRVSVPEENAYSFNLTLPMVSEKELHNMIKLQLQEYVPLSPSEAVFDYDIIDHVDGNLNIGVSVLPNVIIEQYFNFFEQSGMIPIAFEIEAQTLARAVIPKNNKLANMIIDIGRTRTGVAIVKGTVVQYTATLEVGGDSFINAIAKDKNITFAEAEKIKQEVGAKNKGAGSVYSSIYSPLSVLRDELGRRFEYWETHISKKGNKTEKIEKIILCGGNATMPGLKEFLSSGLSTSVEIGNTWVNVFEDGKYLPPIDFNHSLGYASAVGLALSNEI